MSLTKISIAIAELNNHIGTKEIDTYKEKVLKLLPQEYHLDFDLHSNRFCVVNHYGARIL